MVEAIDFINQVGFPIASALGLGFFIWKLINKIIDGIRSLDNQTIRQDVLLKTLLGIPNLIEIDKVSKADREDQRKD